MKLISWIKVLVFVAILLTAYLWFFTRVIMPTPKVEPIATTTPDETLVLPSGRTVICHYTDGERNCYLQDNGKD